MRERVSCVLGKAPVIIICPHGADDNFTDIIAEQAAKTLNCFAVINRGFQRSNVVDVENDFANCNRVDHVTEEVVRDEFLRPILKFVGRLKMSSIASQIVHLFYVHGCGDHVHKEVGERVEVIVGYGKGIHYDSLTCGIREKSTLIAEWRELVTGEVYEGKGGGRYAGRDVNNMNQYFRKHMPSPFVHSMQLEFPFIRRADEQTAKQTGELFGKIMENYMARSTYITTSNDKFI